MELKIFLQIVEKIQISHKIFQKKMTVKIMSKWEWQFLIILLLLDRPRLQSSFQHH